MMGLGWPLTLRQQILGSIFAVLIPSTLFMFYFYPSRQEQLALDGARDRAREAVELVAIAVGQSIGHNDSAGVRTAVEWISQNPALVYVLVNDTAGLPLVRYDPLRLHPTVPSRPAAAVVSLDHAWLRASAPARYRDHVLAEVHLGLSAEVLEEIANDRIVTGVVGCLILALAAAAALYFASQIARPIAALRLASNEIAQGNYQPALPTGGSEETRALSGAFAAMAAEVREATTRLAAARDDALAGEHAKADFLATMSHELRTPLNGVTGMLGLLLDTHLDRSQADYAETARRSAEALLAVINDILDFSKIEAGKLELEQIDFELRHTLEDVVSVLAGTAEAKGLELGMLVAETVPARLRGDPGRLRQILFNLVGNAIKFTSSGEVVVRVMVDAAEAERVMVRYEVTDTGMGIAPEAQVRLFQPFAQADASTTRRFGGTGLGLVICQRLSALMGGEIGVRSTPGAGSTFWFTVALAHAMTAGDTLGGRETALSRLRVLAVDDSWTTLQHLELQLAAWGIGAVAVTDGERALRLLQAAAEAGEPYDLALIDYQMPGVDGLELGRRIKADPATAQTRLVLLTAIGARGQARAADEAGFAAFLTKPLRQSALHDCLVLMTGAGGTAGPPTPRAPLITRHTVAEARGNGRARILVAEDNAINQRVAVGLLERLGYRADVVGNGVEALEAVARRPYDLVLLDCQMPVMDGYDTAAHIRRAEAGGRRLPIIAMTADAMAADRERCMAAGMDDHVPKPVDRNQLREVLNRWLPDSSILGDDSPPPRAPAAEHPLIDPAQLHSIVGDDPAAVRRYLTLYAQTAGELVGRVAAAAVERDGTTLRRLAHTLKGSSGNVGAFEVAMLAERLEQAAGGADWSVTDGICKELKTALTLTVAHVGTLGS